MDNYTASLLDKNHRLEGTLLNLKKQRDQYKTERDNCLKDIEQLRERNRELYQENVNLRNDLEGVETYLDAIKTYYPMYESLRKQYTTLTNHIRQKAEHNPGVSRYIDLVNYIDRLESIDDER